LNQPFGNKKAVRFCRNFITENQYICRNMVVLRCKVILAGDAEVGKSALAQMFQSNGKSFPKNYLAVRLRMNIEFEVNSNQMIHIFESNRSYFRRLALICWSRSSTYPILTLPWSSTSMTHRALTFINSSCPHWSALLSKHAIFHTPISIIVF
jgi:hypothetical protein